MLPQPVSQTSTISKIAVDVAFKLDVSNTTVESLLNTLIKQSPVARMWFIKRYSYDRTFAIKVLCSP